MSLAAAAAIALHGTAFAATAPTGGKVVAGSGSIEQHGAVTTIHQSSQNLSLDWLSFDIGQNNTVNFDQPNGDALAVNRVTGNTASRIFGHLNANGQVWLINPNGVIFGRTAQVNAGSIVASTLEPDADNTDGDVHFSGKGKGKIVNLGRITVAPRGYAALLAGEVSNQGIVTAQLGTVAMGAGSAMTLTFSDNHLLNLQVTRNTLKSLVDNRALVIANGGRVFMTAGARDSLIASAVNNTGVVQAQTVEQHDGSIRLLAGMRNGTTSVSGTLDASAPNGGNGGNIETSAAKVDVAGNALITTTAASGKTGNWLIDPTNYTIAASGGDETGAHLASRLDNTNVTIESSAGGTSGGANPGDASGGNIDVNDSVSWTSGNNLTLKASNNVNIQASLTGGAGSSLTAQAGNGVNVGTSGSIAVGQVTLTTTSFGNQAGATALGDHWKIQSNATNASSLQLGGLIPDFTQYNAGGTFSNVDGAASGNGVLYSVLAPTLTISDLDTGSGLSKGYDGTTTAYLNATNPVNSDGTVNASPTAQQNVTVAGLEAGDQLQSIAVSNAYSQSARGTGLAVSINPANISAAGLSVIDANGAPVYGYKLTDNLTGVASMTGDITQKLLQVWVVGNPTKTYNGTTYVNPTLDVNGNDANLKLVGVAQGDDVKVLHAATINYADINAGTQKPINATFQITDFSIGSGTDKSNYIFPTSLPGGCTIHCQGTINPAPIYVTGLTAENKAYDGTTTATIDGATANGFFGVLAQDQGNVSLDAGQLGSLTGTFQQRGVGSNVPVLLSSMDNLLVFSGAQAGHHNYVIKPDIGLTADITPRPLTVTGASVVAKTYDANTAASLDTTGVGLGNMVAGDGVDLSSAGATGTFAQADAASGIAVGTSGFTIGGADSGNYTLTQPSLIGTINPAPLTITINGPISKTYDGTAFTTLGGSDFTITGWVAGQNGQIGQSTARYQRGGTDDPNAGTGLDVSDAVQPTDFANLAAGTNIANYTWDSSIVGAGVGTINPAPLTGLIVNNPTKVYDGTPDAILTGGNLKLVGVLPGESITTNLAGSAAGTYRNNGNPESNVGTWDVESNAGAITSADFTAGSGTLLSNYILPAQFVGSGTITPAPLSCVGQCITIDLTGHPLRYYDGTTAITLVPTDFTLHLTGFVGGEGAQVNGPIAGNFAQKDAGNDIPVSATLTQSDISGTGGTDLGNYKFSSDGNGTVTPDGLATTVFGTGDILPRILSASVINNPTKTYNGSTDAAVSGGDILLDAADVTAGTASDDGKGLIAGESLAISPTATAAYDSPDATNFNGVGTGAQQISVHLVPGNFASTGNGNVSNYVLPTTATGQGTINKADLVVTGITANDKVYDQTSTATLDYTRQALDGLVSGDVGNVSLVTSGVTANFMNAADTATSAGVSRDGGGAVMGKPVDASGFVLTSVSGHKNLDYNLIAPSGLQAAITPVPVTISGQIVQNKQYDATASADLVLSNGSLVASGGSHGLYAGDSVDFTLTGATNPGDVVVGGGTFGNPNANFATETDADAASGHIPVTTNAFALTGAQAGNYQLVQPALKANIWRAPLAVSVTGDPVKIYDGTALAQLVSSDFTLTGLKGSDSIKITQIAGANYGTKAAPAKNHTGGAALGLYAELAVSDYQPADGTLLSNYVLPDSATGTQGHIEQVPLSFVGTRVYDGSTNAATDLFVSNAGTTDNIATGINNEYLTLSGSAGTVSSPNVTHGIPETVTGLGVVDGDGAGLPSGGHAGLADNYVAGFLLDITPRPLSVSLNGTSGVGGVYQKIYDGNNVYDTSSVVSNGGANAVGLKPVDYTFGAATAGTGFVGAEGDNVSITQTLGHYAGKNVSSSNDVTATLAAGDLSDPDNVLGNYVLPTQAVGNGAIITRKITVNLTGTREYDGTTNAYGKAAGQTQTFAPVDTGVGSEQLVVTGTGQVGSRHVQVGGGGSPTAQVVTDPLDLGFGNGAHGGLASNYDITIGSTAYTITPYKRTYTASRTYDATGDADPTLFAPGNVLGTGVNNEVLGLTGLAGTGGTNGTVSSANVQGTTAAPTAQTVGNLQLADGVAAGGKNAGLASDYDLTFDLTIKPVVLDLGGTRAYDGTTAADADLFGNQDGSIDGITVGGVTQELTLAGAGVTGSKNVGTYARNPGSTTAPATGSSDFGLGTLALGDGAGGIANNYTLVGGSDSFKITPADLATVTIVGTRQYDGTTVALNTDFGSNGVITTSFGETLDVAGQGSLSSANADTYKTSDGTLDLGNPASGGIKLEDGTGTHAGLASNYKLTGGIFTVDPKVLDLTGTRTYDATTNAGAGLFGNQDGTINGVTVGGVTEVLDLTGSGVISSKNVNGGAAYTGTGAGGSPASGQNFNLGTLALGSGTGNGTTTSGGSSGNYTLVGGMDSLTLNKATLTVTGTVVATKTYNGLTNDAALSDSTLLGVLSNAGVADDVTLGGDSIGTYASPDAGTQNVTTSMTLGGNDADNYTLVQPSGITGLINKAPLTVTANDDSKVYDGQSYSGDSQGVGYTGFVNGEGAGVLGGTLGYTGNSQGAVNAGSYTITPKGLTSGNYAITFSDGGLAVAKAVLGLTGTRTYDGTTGAGASLFGNQDGTINGVTVGGTTEQLTLTGAGVTGSKNVGTYARNPGSTTVPAAGSSDFGLGTLTLANGAGGLADNYTLVGGADSLTLTKRDITATFDADNKTYDGTTAATVDHAALTHNGDPGVAAGTGLIAGDTVTLTDPTQGIFGNKNAGTGITVTGDMGITGSDAGNYTFTNGTDTADIGRVVLDLTGARTYDGKTDAAADLFGNQDGSINGVTVSGTTEQLTLTGAGVTGSKNVGTYARNPGSTTVPAAGSSDFGLGTLTLGNGVNGLADNYTLVGGNDSVKISKAALTIAAKDDSKVYDGQSYSGDSQGVTYTGFVNGEGSGVLGGALGYTGNSQGAVNAGSYTITPKGLTSDNYAITFDDGALTVNKVVLDLTGTRTYDGKTDAAANLFGNQDGTINGVTVGGTTEQLTLTGAGVPGSKNVGTYARNPGSTTAPTAGSSDLGLGTLVLGDGTGGLASNYTLVGGDDSVAITKTTLTIAANDDSKVYDGLSYNGDSQGVSYTGFVNGEGAGVLGGALGYTGSSQGAVNAGSYTITPKGLTSDNYAITFSDGGLAVAKAVLDLTGTRIYDGTTGAGASLFGNQDGTIDGVTVGGTTEQLTLTGAGVTGSKNVGTYARNPGSTTAPAAGSSDFGLGTLALGNGAGGLADNYALVGGDDSLGITPASVGLSGVIISGGRQYDGTTVAENTDFGSNGVITTTLGETLHIGGQGTLSSANVGTYQTSDGSFTLGNPASGGIKLEDGTGSHAGEASNYSLTGGTFAVTRRVLDLTGTRIYDGKTGAVADLFGNQDGSIDGVTAGGVTEQLTLTGTGLTGSKNVGTYARNPGSTTAPAAGSSDFGLGTLTLANGAGGLASNYTLVGGNDTLQVTMAALTVTANARSKVYGDALGLGTADFTVDDPTQLQNSEAVTAVELSSTGHKASNTGTDAGSYVGNITAGNATGANGFLASNYAITFKPGDLTVTPAPLVLNIDDAVKTYGDALVFEGTEFSVTDPAQLKNGNDVDKLTLSSAGTSRSAGAGHYTITGAGPTGGHGFDARNYDVTINSGTLTVDKATLTVTANDDSKIYDGQPYTGDSNGVTYTGLVNGEGPDVLGGTLGYTGSSQGAVNAGGYLVTPGGLASDNYAIRYGNGTLTILGISPEQLGIPRGTLQSVLAYALAPYPIATPYGLTQTDTVGMFSGNHKRTHRPVVSNRALPEFNSGMALKVIDGGVRMPGSKP